MSDREAGDRRPVDGRNDVMATVDRSADEPLFVVADVSADGAWIATPTCDAVPLGACR